MADEYIAKTFKSGNSVALRLPKALGVREGMAMKVRQERGGFVVEPVEQPKRKFDVERIWGIGRHLDLKPLTPDDREFAHRTLPWGDGGDAETPHES